MSKMPFLLAACAATMFLGGCNTYSYRGHNHIVDVEGAPIAANDGYVGPKTELFVEDYQAAYSKRSGSGPGDSTLNIKMMESGFMYNYAFCSSYFDSMALRQRDSKVIRRVLPSLSTLITGVVGLHDFSGNPDTKERLVQGVALGSAFATSLLDVYEEQFLYGTDNINSVETMTLKALNTHSAAAMAQSNVGFGQATQHLIDNQDLCAPQSVLNMARNAIKAAKVSTETKDQNGAVVAAEAATGRVDLKVGE